MFRKLRSFMAGNVPLAKTYWFYGVIIGNILIGLLLLPAIMSNAVSIASFPLGRLLLMFLGLLPTFYFLIVYVAIWNSAGKYEGEAVWRWLARMIVILNVLYLTYSYYQEFQPVKRLTTQIKLLQSSLPLKVDEYTSLTQVNQTKSMISYVYIVTGEMATLERFTSVQKKNISAFICNHDLLKEAIAEGYTINFSYNTEARRNISKVSVKSKDCTD